MKQALTFDDVLLQPGPSDVLPGQVDTSTTLCGNLNLGIPILSAAMDTVTEARLAISMAQSGGMGILHRNLTAEQQARNVEKVKKFESGMVIDPVTISPTRTLAEAQKVMADRKISGLPVVEADGKLVGILTNRDVRFATNPDQPIYELMTKENLITVKEGVSQEEAKMLFHKSRIEKLVVVDDEYKCVGLITVKDMDKAKNYPNACKDELGRLRVGAATTVGEKGLYYAQALIDAGVDMLVIDTAHGHSSRVIESVEQIRKLSNSVKLVAGNVATASATEALIKAGADAVKVGIGPGSICTTRIVAGVGVPQLTAIMDCVEAADKFNATIIADGGIKYSGDFAKAIAAGAACVMVGSMLAGTTESPGETFLYQGRTYKSYRGMGSVGAMAGGSADRYFQQEVSETHKLVPEGIEGQVAFKGSVESVLHQMVGGLRASMGYVGGHNLKDFQKKAEFVQITSASLRESHTHDVTITREAPNYPTKM
ncbi:MAG: IMP dehydrogenase [Alphaproteobacteria bacterium]|nr:IMP dehydrogenase [Alphaproteobacteria bacterium]